MSNVLARFAAPIAAVLLAAAVVPALADEQFDLDVQLGISAEMAARLTPNDTIQVTLRPAPQYGKTASDAPVVVSRKWEPTALAQPVKFKEALKPDVIYRLDVVIVREGGKKPLEVRYLSALDKLPRRPVERGAKLRLFVGDQKDQRANLVLLTRDKDGIYRLMMFTA